MSTNNNNNNRESEQLKWKTAEQKKTNLLNTQRQVRMIMAKYNHNHATTFCYKLLALKRDNPFNFKLSFLSFFVYFKLSFLFILIIKKDGFIRNSCNYLTKKQNNSSSN